MAHTDWPVLSPEQTLVMYALVARQGFIAQNDLGVPIHSPDRILLEKQRLVETVKREQNALWMRLTEDGWSWCEAHMNKALPPTHSVLHHFLLRLSTHLEAHGETLQGFIGKPEPGPMDPEASV